MAGRFFSHLFNTRVMDTVKISTIKAVLEASETVTIGRVDTDFCAKLKILPEGRVDGDYKISLSLRKSHFDGDDIEVTMGAVRRILESSRDNAEAALAEYFSGGGQQLSLFSDGPRERKKRGRLASTNSDLSDLGEHEPAASN